MLDASVSAELGARLLRIGDINEQESALLTIAVMSSQCSAVYDFVEGQEFGTINSATSIEAASQESFASSIILAEKIGDGSLALLMEKFKALEKVRILRDFSENSSALDRLLEQFKKCEVLSDNRLNILSRDELMEKLSR